ncbi:MAG: rhodanese-like domain-containing protein [Motiliproteus sp.]
MKKTLFASLICLLGTFFSTAQAATPASIFGTTLVNAEELIALVEEKDELLIIDARTVADYTKGHLPDSVNLANTDTNADSLAKTITSKESPVLFYCNGINCGRSVESCKVAVAAGYSNIYWFRGGIGEWNEKGYPTEQ